VGPTSDFEQPSGSTHGGGDDAAFSMAEEDVGDTPFKGPHADRNLQRRAQIRRPRRRGGQIWRLMATWRPRSDAVRAAPTEEGLTASTCARSDEGVAGSNDRGGERQGRRQQSLEGGDDKGGGCGGGEPCVDRPLAMNWLLPIMIIILKPALGITGTVKACSTLCLVRC
jgi:hypothetical protein